MATYVVVHGAWGGAWSWNRIVLPMLRAVDKAPDSPQAKRAAAIKADQTWQYVELQTGHNLHYSAPQETVDILIGLA